MRRFLVVAAFLLMFNVNAHADEKCYTVGGYLAGKTISLFTIANTFAAQKNYGQLQKMVDSGLVYILRKNVPVYVNEVKSKQEKIKITFVDVKLTLWTSIRAVDCRKR